MKLISIPVAILFLNLTPLSAQPSTASRQAPPAGDAWHIVADNIDPANYYGITVANGMIGLVSSPEPMKVKDVVLNGAYDNYQRGRVELNRVLGQVGAVLAEQEKVE